MTRKEEMIKAARCLKKAQKIGIFEVQSANQCLKDAALQDAFIKGAEWADAHNEGLNMHIKYLKEELIDKACEWLEKNVGLVYNFNGDENTSTFIEDFREAMEGGEE